LPYYLTLLAEAYGNAGQVQQGLKYLDEALDFAEKNNDDWYSAETHRLMGELMLQTGEGKGGTCFQKSLDKASQKARTLELRATVPCPPCKQTAGKPVACQGIFHWFSEGFDLVDLKVARKLIDELS
jgi:hypothetical protein